MANGKRKIVLASRNADKVREMRQLCQDMPFEVTSSADYDGLPEVIEDGTTPLGNAARKAIVTAAYTGEIAVADDTTLQVPTLGGLPDIFAARFAGPEATYADNAELLVELLRDVPDGFRQARFETAIAWVDPRPGGGGDAAGAAAGEALSEAMSEVMSPAMTRWLRNPYERAIHIRKEADESAFWNNLADRRTVWQRYRTDHETILQFHGTDREKVLGVLDRLLAPYLVGGRPEGTDAADVQLPDTRIWTVSGPQSNEPPPTIVAPTGLPTDAPGRAVNEPFWLEISTEGRLLGEITREALGSAGFGYDPIFRPMDDDRTLAELDPVEKNAISHRGRALRRLITAVEQAYGVRQVG